jgi:C1A family cysteine protease
MKKTMILVLMFFVMSFSQTELAKIQKSIKENNATWIAKETDISEYQLGVFKPMTTKTALRKVSKHNEALPSVFSWRNYNGFDWMTSVKNQGRCGSCWAFAAGGAFEADLKIAMNKPMINFGVSEQSMVSCWVNSCGGNSMENALENFNSVGVPDENCFPYTSTDAKVISCSNQCMDWERRTFLVKDWGCLYHPTVNEMKTELFNNGPVVMVFMVFNDFFFYKSGIYVKTSGPDDFAGFHAVVLCGWDDVNKCWLVKNSWGSSWGENGYFRIRMGTNESGCENYCYWLEPEVVKYTPIHPEKVR